MDKELEKHCNPVLHNIHSVYTYLVNVPQPVQYQLYTSAFHFDLRCESVTLYILYVLALE